MQKKILYLILLLMVSFAVSGCSETSSAPSYQGVLKLHDQHYIYQGEVEDGEYTLGGKIGEVHRKVSVQTMPEDNFSSNYIERGENIYFAEEDKGMILVKRKNGSIDIFTK